MAWSNLSMGIMFWLASTIAVVVPTLAYTPAAFVYNDYNTTHSQTIETPFPYDFPNMETPLNLFPMPLCNGLTLEEATIDQLQEAMNNGRLTSTDLVTCYLQRIYQTDSYVKYVNLHDLLLS
jgi:amidase